MTTAIADLADFDCEFARDLFCPRPRPGNAGTAFRRRRPTRPLTVQAARPGAAAWPALSRLTATSSRGVGDLGAAGDQSAAPQDPIRSPWHGALHPVAQTARVARSLGRTQDFALTQAQEAFLHLGAVASRADLRRSQRPRAWLLTGLYRSDEMDADKTSRT